MTSWGKVVTPSVIKRKLPLEYVCMREGIDLELTYDGRLIGKCPFHADSNPSFAIFGDKLDKAGCWSCDFRSGDLFDIITRTEHVSFGEATVIAAAMLEEFERDTWQPTTPVERAYDQAMYQDIARQGWRTALVDRTALDRLVAAKDWEVDPEWLHTEWWVGTVPPATVLIPHLNSSRRVTGVKSRYAGLPPYAVSGSKFPHLYGEWRFRRTGLVVLCEGESDTWTGSWRFPTVDVLGLPTGAGTRPTPLHTALLKQADRCVIVFDGDEAGRLGASRWEPVLKALGVDVRVVDLPDGRDLTSCPDLEVI
jgi:DNA primase